MPEGYEQGVHVVNVDEKTGIQVPEQIYPTRSMEPGKVEALEFEYRRHSMQTLIISPWGYYFLLSSGLLMDVPPGRINKVARKLGKFQNAALI